MAKRWKKQKAGTQTKKRRKKPQGGGSSSGSSGAMGGLRGMMKSVAGTGGKKKADGGFDKMLNALLWIAVAVVGVIFVYRQCA